jgi:ABC-type iron transport system FetAB permease component
MKTSTKLKKLLQHNTATFSLNDNQFEIIVTNNYTGNSHLCIGANLSQAVERAFRDSIKASQRKDMNF